LSTSDNPQFDPLSPSAHHDPAQAPLAIPAETPVALATPSIVQASGENPVWNGWDVLLIAILTVLTLIVVELMTVLGARVFVYPHASLGELAQMPKLALIGEFLAYIGVAIYMILLVEGKYHQAFSKAIMWNWRGKPAFGLFGLGVLTVALDLLSRFLPMPKSTPFDQFFAHPTDAYLIAAFAVTVGPLMEELLFRGFLYPVLARSTGVGLAVFLTALPFGLMHYLQYRSWSAVLVITLVGVVLTTVRAVTKSVAASFLVHVGYNFTLMVLAAIATDGFRHMDKASIVLPR